MSLEAEKVIGGGVISRYLMAKMYIDSISRTL